MIPTLAMIKHLFRQMRSENVDPHSVLLWGYFFVDRSRAKLEVAARQLESSGYRFVEIFEHDAGFTLHREKAERHFDYTLNDRNFQLDGFARVVGVRYDGFDVGPLPPEGDGGR